MKCSKDISEKSGYAVLSETMYSNGVNIFSHIQEIKGYTIGSLFPFHHYYMHHTYVCAGGGTK